MKNKVIFLVLFHLFIVRKAFKCVELQKKEKGAPSQVPTADVNDTSMNQTSNNGTMDMKIVSASDIVYLLYNRDHRKADEEFITMLKNGSVPKGIWQAGNAVKVLIHGFLNSAIYTYLKNVDFHNKFSLVRAYARGNSSLNLIFVDWTKLSALYHSYPKVVEYTRIVGRDLAELLTVLKDNGEINALEDVHLIGFSLGAHVAGIAGYEVQQICGSKVGRVSGIDPAGPNYDGPNGTAPANLTTALDRGDGEFVDVMHTNMGYPPNYEVAMVPHGRMGSAWQAGHADFYPNDGTTQAYECTMKKDYLACSHMAGVSFWALSIANYDFLACPCDSWEEFANGTCSCDDTNGGQQMGEKCSPKASGRYYLNVDYPIKPLPYTDQEVEEIAPKPNSTDHQNVTGEIEMTTPNPENYNETGIGTENPELGTAMPVDSNNRSYNGLESSESSQDPSKLPQTENDSSKQSEKSPSELPQSTKGKVKKRRKVKKRKNSTVDSNNSSYNASEFSESSQEPSKLPTSSNETSDPPKSKNGSSKLPESSDETSDLPKSEKGPSKFPKSSDETSDPPKSKNGSSKLPESSSETSDPPKSEEDASELPQSSKNASRSSKSEKSSSEFSFRIVF